MNIQQEAEERAYQALPWFYSQSLKNRQLFALLFSHAFMEGRLWDYLNSLDPETATDYFLDILYKYVFAVVLDQQDDLNFRYWSFSSYDGTFPEDYPWAFYDEEATTIQAFYFSKATTGAGNAVKEIGSVEIFKIRAFAAYWDYTPRALVDFCKEIGGLSFTEDYENVSIIYHIASTSPIFNSTQYPDKLLEAILPSPLGVNVVIDRAAARKKNLTL